MSIFKKKTFYPPEVAETTIGHAGQDVTWINKQLAYKLAEEDTAQKAWSEYMKVLYALTLGVVAAKRPDISKDFSYFLKNATEAKLRTGIGTDILKREVCKESWFKDAQQYQSLLLDEIPAVLYKNIVPLLPYSLDEGKELALRRYLNERIPFINSSLMKLNFDIYSTRAELKANPPSTQ
jgi:hypothetical protein